MSTTEDGRTCDRLVVVLLDSYDYLGSLGSLRANVEAVIQAWSRAGFTFSEPGFLGAGTLTEIQAWVSKWNPPPARQLLVYWSGHGKQLDDRTFVLLARDTDVNAIDTTNTFSVEQLGTALSRYDADEILVFVDACHSGGGHREIIDAFVRNSRRRVRSAGRSRPAIAAIASADYDEYAGENVFSRALARILRQGPPKGYWGDQQRDFTVAELVAALRATISEGEVDQQPQFAMDGTSTRHGGDLRIPNPRFQEFAPDVDGESIASAIPVSREDLDEHFWVKFRGIDSTDQRGFFFTGRARVLREINGWLANGTGMLVVTGRPGVGKSALLGRTVIMSTPALRQRLVDSGIDMSRMDPTDLPPDHAIDVAIHARNHDLSDCMTAIGAALRMSAPNGGWRNAAEFVCAVAELRRPVTILVDALDEARPIDALRIARELLSALAATPGVRVVVGTRTDASDALAGPLEEPTTHNTILRALGTPPLVDVVDVGRYDATGDIYAYAAARLRSFPASVYASDDPATARRVARLASAITERCHGSFLLARIATRALATHESQLNDDALVFDTLVRSDIDGAISADLARYGYEEEKVDDLLTALAMAEGAGLPRRNVWLTIANAVRQRETAYADSDLVWTLNHAGTYITQSGEQGETVYRLYHQALTEYFRSRTDLVRTNCRIAEALVDWVSGPTGDRRWDRVNPYTREHLSTHAANGQVLLDILDDRIFHHVGAGRMTAALLRTADAAPDEATLDRAVALLRVAIAATAGSESDQDAYRRSLVAALQIREQRSQSAMDADEAVSLNEDLLLRTAADSPAYAGLLANLGSALQIRFTHTGNRTDLGRAIDVLRQSTSLTSPDDPTRYDHLHHLGQALFTLAEHNGDPSVLDQAISALREATDGTAANHPRRHRVLTILGAALRLRLEWTGVQDDLDEAIALSAQAAGLATAEDPRRALYLSNLASALLLRYTETGSQDDLTQAVLNARTAVEAADPRNPRLGQFHAALSLTLRTRYLDSDDPTDIQEAALHARRAVAATATEDPERPRRLSILGAILVTAYEATAQVALLDEALSACVDAMRALPAGHPDQADALVALGLVEYHRFAATASLPDLESSIQALIEAVDLTPARHLGRAQRLLALARSLRARFNVTADHHDLDQSIAALQDAATTTSAESPEQATYLIQLADNLRSRSELTGQPEDLDEAEAYLERASAVTTAPVAVRMRAARDRGALAAAAGRFGQATDGYATAVSLLPRVAGRGFDRRTAMGHLAEWGSLAADAAACALSAGSIDLAVQLLEQGRGVLWTQVLRSRDDLSALSDVAPALAARLEVVRNELAEGGKVTSAAVEPADLTRGTSEQVDRRLRLAHEWDDLVSRVRSLPGFEDFLRGPRIETLLATTTDGPIVIVNVSRYRCDALVLRPAGVEVIALPRLRADEAQEWQNVLLHAVQSFAGSAALSDVLAWLWETTVGPILQAVGYTSPPSKGPWPRIWWCPTGPLTLMPLHAAGRAGNGGDRETAESALDRVVSSYLPTAATLGHVRAQSVSPLADGVLAVGMPNTAGREPLPYARREVEIVRQLAAPERAVVLLDAHATVQAVVDNMDSHRWVHFACHSVQNIDDPAHSALVLHDGSLTTFDVAALHIEGAEFMYLASCQTAMGSTSLLDESIHMSAAMQLAGYRHVIAALWPIDDRTASEIAETMYHRLPASGKLHGGEAARALHDAVRALRVNFPQHPFLWAPFIHSGP